MERRKRPWPAGKHWKVYWRDTPSWGRGKGHWDGHFKRGHKWKDDRGQTPWWERGKGYWDGHFKHHKWRPPIYEAPQYYYGPAEPYYYAPPPPPEFYDEYSWQHGGFE